MRLVSLNLKNYRQFKEAAIEFPDGVIGIIGLNGVGKSSLVESIAWALYGNIAARTEKEGIKRVGAPAAANVEVELELEINAVPYRTSRALRGVNQIGQALLLSQNKIMAESVKGVDAEINYILGMDCKAFYTSFFAKQKELNALTVYTPAERKNVIIRMLRIDAIDKVIDLIRSETREKKLEAEVLKKSLKDENLLESERLAKQKELKQEEDKLKKYEEKCKELEIELDKFKDRFIEERKTYEQYHELDKKISQLEARLVGLRKREEELSQELSQIIKMEKEIKLVEKDAKEYEILEKRDRELDISEKTEQRMRERRKKELEEELKKIAEDEKRVKPGDPCPTCGQAIKDFEKLKEHFAKEKEKIKLEINALKKPYDLEEHRKVKEALKVKREVYEKYPKLLAKVEKKDEIQKSSEQIQNEINTFGNELTKTINQQKEIPYDEKEHQRITSLHDQTKLKLDAAYAQRNKEKIDQTAFKKELEKIEEEIKSVRFAKENIQNLLKEQEKKNKLVQIMTEYRTHLISRIRPELSSVAGHLFSQLTDGKYQGIELDEEYEMYIYEGGIKYPLPRFSGGETDLANLCLRLAISQLIAGSSGIEGGFIILDEIFGSQDLIRKSSIINTLQQLSKQFRQIILITHVEEIKDSFEHIIEVQEDEFGISHVRQ